MTMPAAERVLRWIAVRQPGSGVSDSLPTVRQLSGVLASATGASRST